MCVTIKKLKNVRGIKWLYCAIAPFSTLRKNTPLCRSSQINVLMFTEHCYSYRIFHYINRIWIIQVFRFRFGFPWETSRPIVKRRESRGDSRPHARDNSSVKKKITRVFSEAGAVEFPDRIGAVASDRVTAWLDSRVNFRCHGNRLRCCSMSRREYARHLHIVSVSSSNVRELPRIAILAIRLYMTSIW